MVANSQALQFSLQGSDIFEVLMGLALGSRELKRVKKGGREFPH
jgi:hypothetical protein